MFTSIVTNYKQKKKTHITTFYKLDSTKAIEPQLYTQKKNLLRWKTNTNLLFVEKEVPVYLL